MKRPIKYILGLSWLVLVAFFFYKNHPYYHFDLPGVRNWWPLWGIPLVAYGLFIFINWAAERKTIRVKLTVPRILATLFLSLFFVGVTTVLQTQPLMYLGPHAVIMNDGSTIIEPTPEQAEQSNFTLYYGSTLKDNFGFYEGVSEEIRQNLVKTTFGSIIGGLSWTFIKIYGLTLILLLYASILGSACFKLLNRRKEPREDNFEHEALVTALGLGLVSTILFLMAAIGLFNLPTILAALILPLLPLYKHTLQKLKVLWNFERKIEFSLTDFTLPLLIFIALIFGVHMFDNLSPLPRGWDGLNRYMIIAKDLAEGGNLLERGAMYGWELLLGLAYLIDIKLALAWTSFPGVLTFVFIWLLAKRYASSTAVALAIATIAVAPIMSFHLSDENKVDVAHWLIGSASILAFLKALSFEGRVKIKDKSYLWLSALLAGFAFTMKLTASILIVTILSTFGFIEGGLLGLFAAVLIATGALASAGGIGLGQEFTTPENLNPILAAIGVIGGLILTAIGFVRKKITKNAIQKLGILLILILIPIAPWFIKNALETNSMNPGDLIYGGNEAPSLNFENDKSICNVTGFFEEYDRYIGYNDNLFLRVIELPWHLTMNDTGALGAYVDIGFAFLGFTLLFFLFYKPGKKKNILVIFGLIYLFFWLIKANGVIWYGFPFFSLMGVALAYLFTQMEKDRVGKLILLIALGAWLLTAFDARLNNYAKPGLFLSHTNQVSNDDIRESIFPYTDDLNAILTENEGLVYKIGTPLGYFIPNYVQRSFDDQLLDTFTCTYLNQNEDFDALRNQLRDLGFSFLLYDSYTRTVGNDPEGTLATKIATFEQFADQQLFLVIFDDKRGHHLFYIPSDEELYQEPEVTPEGDKIHLDIE